MTETETFDLSLAEVPIKIKDKDGTVHNYTITELTGDQRDAYIDRMLKASDGQAGKLTKVSGITPFFLSLCVVDENGKNVPVSVAGAWPAKVQTALMNKGKALSGLDDAALAADAAKKD